MLKLMIVPYINKPPTMDMIIAGGVMMAQCASNTGSAVRELESAFV